MPFMEWSEKYELGITKFDDDHKQLVNLLNRTYRSFTDGAKQDEIMMVLDELCDYATYHFSAEEHWMRVNKYPGLPDHIEEHEKFCNRVTEIQKDIHKGRESLSLEVLTFLMNWLTNHILVSDAVYGVFAKNLPIPQVV